VPPGSPIVFALDAGEFVFRIYPREGNGTAAGNPRLDCLCLAEDPTTGRTTRTRGQRWRNGLRANDRASPLTWPVVAAECRTE